MVVVSLWFFGCLYSFLGFVFKCDRLKLAQHSCRVGIHTGHIQSRETSFIRALLRELVQDHEKP